MTRPDIIEGFCDGLSRDASHLAGRRCAHCGNQVNRSDRSIEQSWCVYCWPGIERVRQIWREKGMIG